MGGRGSKVKMGGGGLKKKVKTCNMNNYYIYK